MSTSKRKDLVAAMFLELRRMVANSVLFNLRMAETLEVNPTDLQFINFLELYGPLTPGKLAEFSRLTTGGVTVVLNRLEKAGVITRQPNPDDRRSSLVHVAPKFLRSARSAYAGMSDATNALLAQFSDKELAVVAAFLKRANDSRV
jgi:MarR family transcriptional regulator, organic hydroperoxide resistance regulator